MAARLRKRPKLPADSGDLIVAGRSAYGSIGLLLGFIAMGTLGMLIEYHGQTTTSDRLGVVVSYAIGAAMLVLMLVVILVWDRPWLQISAETIRYIEGSSDPLTLHCQSGNALRIVYAGTLRLRPGLTVGDSQPVLPIRRFSARKLRQACTARGWDFPPVIGY